MDEDGTTGGRKVRSDALRSRAQLIGAAKAAFTEKGADAALEEIARRAGVGIGTLYRHFPTREALMAAVYRQEVEDLGAAAGALLASSPPGAALEAWLHQLIDTMAAKGVIAPALAAAPAGDPAAASASRSAISDALRQLTAAAIASGDIRADIGFEDLGRLLSGLSVGYDRPEWAPSARRLIGVIITGLRPEPPPRAPAP